MAYNSRHTAHFYDGSDWGNRWDIDIAGLDYAGSPVDISLMAGTPLKIDYGQSAQNPVATPVFDMRATLGLLSNSLLGYAHLYSNNQKEHKVTVKLNGTPFFVGFLVGDTYQEPYRPAPFFVYFQANDGLLLLKDRKWDITESLTPLQVFTRCLKETGLNLNFNITLNTDVAEPVAELTPLDDVYMDVTHFATDEKTYFDVLQEFLTAFGCIIKQTDGEWHIIQVIEQTDGSYNYTQYDADGNELSSGSRSPIVDCDHRIEDGRRVWDVQVLTAATRLKINPGFKKIRIEQNLVSKPTVLTNGEFDDSKQLDFAGTFSFTGWSPTYTELLSKRVKDGDNYMVVRGGELSSNPSSASYVSQEVIIAAGSGMRVKIKWAVLGSESVSVTGDVYIRLSRGPYDAKIVDTGNGYEGDWTPYENFIKLGTLTAKESQNIEFQTFELYFPEIIGTEGTPLPIEIRLLEPVNVATPDVDGSCFASVSLEMTDTDGDPVTDEIVTERLIDANSNYVPETINLNIGDAPVDFENAMAAYTNIFVFDESVLANYRVIREWKYVRENYTGTLLEVLAQQIETLFGQPRLMLMGSINSDILKPNSLLEDTDRLGSKLFMLNRASLDCKRANWSGVELMELSGELPPDFYGPDFDGGDFFTGE